MSVTIVPDTSLPADLILFVGQPSPSEETAIRRLTMEGVDPLQAKVQVLAKAGKITAAEVRDWRSPPGAQPIGGVP